MLKSLNFRVYEVMNKFAGLVFVGIASSLIGCNSGGGSSNSNPYTGISPYPYPAAQPYATLPNGFSSAIPSFVPQTTSNGLQIAYGYSTNSAAESLAAYVQRNGSALCSATPVASDGAGGTWLVGAAHCFVTAKSSASVLLASELLTPTSIAISKGFGGAGGTTTTISSSATIFLPSNYCDGGTFSSLGNCPNFTPEDGGQGNDIALIHIANNFNPAPYNYPQLNDGSLYPTAYTMAPVLSLGYGSNNVNGGSGQLFYVMNYFYQQSDNTGYHYLYNSYFNPAAANYGYSALVCGGDSGGGDLFSPDGSSWILLSEHTYGPTNACGTFYSSLPNAATNVSKYYDWLTSIISGEITVANCNASNNCVTNGS